MELTLHAPEDALLIQSWQPGSIRVAGQNHDTPLLLTPSALENWQGGLPQGWSDEAMQQHCDSWMAHQVELMLIGTGEAPGLPEPRLLASLAGRGLGCDFMPSRAACHTWNILQADGRRAILLLLG